MFEIESIKSKIHEILFEAKQKTIEWKAERNEISDLLALIFNKHKNRKIIINEKVSILILILF